MRWFYLAFLLLGGCLSVPSMQDRLDAEASAVARTINYYCRENTSVQLRLAFRAAVNARIQPNSITVTCRRPEGEIEE